MSKPCPRDLYNLVLGLECSGLGLGTYNLVLGLECPGLGLGTYNLVLGLECPGLESYLRCRPPTLSQSLFTPLHCGFPAVDDDRNLLQKSQL